MTIEQHPHEAWQSAVFGCAHISQHRTLAHHHVATQHLADLLRPISRDEQVARLRTMDAGFAHDMQERHRPFDPVADVVRGARTYNRSHGLDDPHSLPYHQVRTTSNTIDRVGSAYGALPDFDKRAIPHFHAMGEEVGRQFDHLTRPRHQGGMGVNVESVDHDPYANVHEMVHDLRNNNRLQVMGTHVTGGHPYFSNDQNDRFRAVHDAFGHAATGRGFDASGEEGAYLAHSRMFTHHALPAMQSETRGQNGFVHLNNDFGPQKVALLPEHIRNIPVIGATPTQRVAKATDWDEYRRIQDAQDRRYERPGIVGGQEEHDQFYGRGEHAGAGTEHRLTPQEWMRHSHEPSFDELPPQEHEWHWGYDLGAQHSQHIDNGEFDHAYSGSAHPDHFFSGYTEGLSSVASANPLSTPQGVVAHEEGRQSVRDINGTPLCDWHADRAKELMGLSDQIGRQTGLIDETEPHTHTETPTYPGQCAACASAQGKNEGRPWEAPQGGFRPSPMSEHQVSQRAWPNKPRRTGPMPLLPQSMSYRVAVRRGQGVLPQRSDGLQRIAHHISTDMPDIVVLHKLAHDSGDGQTILHCPFCGSGQVIATSDGGVNCEFCKASFTVQIQPQYPAFPQSIDGAPVNVPGMGPDFSPYGGTPPGAEAPMPMDGEEDDTDEGDPMGTNADETEPPPEDDEDDEDSNNNGPITKKTYRTMTGVRLDREAYLRHLALACSPDTQQVLRRVRAVNGTGA
jgi:hypothetical protein